MKGYESMNDKKINAFESHKDIILLIWMIGKGVMFRGHLVRYFLLLGYRRKDIDVALADIKSADLIDVIRFGNSHVLKLKKFSIYTLQKKQPENVSSVQVTTTRILKSAFLNERILSILKTSKNATNFNKGTEHLVRIVLKHFSHVSLERQNYSIFLRQIMMKNNEVITDFMVTEVNDLQIMEQHSTTLKPSFELAKKIQDIREVRARRPEGNFNLNSLSARNIYFSLGLYEEGYVLQLDFVDLYSNMTGKQFLVNMIEAFRYMDSLVGDDVKIKVSLLVSGDGRREYFESKKDQLLVAFLRSEHLIDFEFDVVDLNIEKRLFENMAIIR